MKKFTNRTLNLLADALEAGMRHLTPGTKRSRRHTTKKRSYTRRQKTPVLIIKIMMEQ